MLQRERAGRRTEQSAREDRNMESIRAFAERRVNNAGSRSLSPFRFFSLFGCHPCDCQTPENKQKYPPPKLANWGHFDILGEVEWPIQAQVGHCASFAMEIARTV